MSYASDYLDVYARTKLGAAEQQAAAQRSRGAGFANALGQIGQTVAQIPQQMREAKVQQQEDEVREIQLGSLKAGQKKATVLADAYRNALMPDGQVDRQKLTATLSATPYADALPDIMKGLDQAEQANLSVKNARQASEQAELGYAKTLGEQIIASDFNPEIVNGLLTVAETHGHDVKSYKSLWESKPDQFKTFVTNLARPVKPAEPFTLNPGDTRFDANGKPIATAPEKPEKLTFGAPTPAMIGGQRVFIRTGSDGKTYDMQGKPVADVPKPIAPEGAQPSFTTKEILLPDGTVKTANYNNRTGKYTDVDTGAVLQGVGRAPTDKDIAALEGKKKLGGIVSALSGLSEKINTSQGVIATLKGKEEKAKASVNLNDDVAEYQSIIESFTPIIARALGHTGVLTQQDVDSAKAMFPKPEDSKSLRDRKVKRLNELLGLQPAQKISVTAPDGSKHEFETQAQADAFKKLAGIK